MLVLNGGSSSIKCALFNEQLQRQWSGEIQKIGTGSTALQIEGGERIPFRANSIPDAAGILMQWLQKNNLLNGTLTVVHRIVHGMQHTRPQIISPRLLDELKQLIPYDPEHLPGEIALIESVQHYYPAYKQIACFDTAFHAHLPAIATRLPIPRAYAVKGIRKYGFHGLSCNYIMQELSTQPGFDLTGKKIIIAHLGNGSSMTAIKDGRSIDTTMGFTPAGGLMMGTRTGDLDPGVAWFLMQEKSMNASAFSRLINHDSGLLGVSGKSADMQELLAEEHSNPAAAEAIALYCYQAKKWLGALTAALGGLDLLVFTGGIGEHSPVIRNRICTGLDYLGIRLSDEFNEAGKTNISIAGSPVRVMAMNTNEELMMARIAKDLLSQAQ